MGEEERELWVGGWVDEMSWELACFSTTSLRLRAGERKKGSCGWVNESDTLVGLGVEEGELWVGEWEGGWVDVLGQKEGGGGGG